MRSDAFSYLLGHVHTYMHMHALTVVFNELVTIIFNEDVLMSTGSWLFPIQLSSCLSNEQVSLSSGNKSSKSVLPVFETHMNYGYNTEGDYRDRGLGLSALLW